MAVSYLYQCDTEGCDEFIVVPSYRIAMTDSRAEVRKQRWQVTTRPKLIIACPEHGAWTQYQYKGFDPRRTDDHAEALPPSID